jgi:20S proteasome subunit alpha 5
MLGTTAIGLKTKEGVVLAAEKKILSTLMIPSSSEKIMQIDTHVGCVLSGLVADARTLVDHARVEAQNHRFTYNEPLTVEAVTQIISDLAINFGGKDDAKTKPMARPYGVSLLIAGYDENGPQLYQTDPSGNFMSWEGRAIGPACEGAQSLLMESYKADMKLKDAEILVLQILKTVMQEKVMF